MKLSTLNIIVNNVKELGIETLTMVELNNIGAYLEEKGVKTLDDAKFAVDQYVKSHK